MCTILDSDNDLEDGNDLDVLDEYASEDIFVESSSDEDDDHNDFGDNWKCDWHSSSDEVHTTVPYALADIIQCFRYRYVPYCNYG